MDPLALAGGRVSAGAQMAASDGSSEAGAPYTELTPTAGEYVVMTPSEAEDGGRSGRSGAAFDGAGELEADGQAALADAGGSRFAEAPGGAVASDVSDLERESREVEAPFEDPGKVEGEANEVSPRYATETTALLVRDDAEGALSATAPLLHTRRQQSHATDTRHVPPTRTRVHTAHHSSDASGGGAGAGSSAHARVRSPAMGGVAATGSAGGSRGF